MKVWSVGVGRVFWLLIRRGFKVIDMSNRGWSNRPTNISHQLLLFFTFLGIFDFVHNKKMSIKRNHRCETQATVKALRSVFICFMLRYMLLELGTVVRDETALWTAELSFKTFSWRSVEITAIRGVSLPAPDWRRWYYPLKKIIKDPVKTVIITICYILTMACRNSLFLCHSYK